MNPAYQALRLGDSLEKRDELRALRRVEGGQKLGLVLLGHAFEIGEQVAPARRQEERVRASVGGVAAALGEPAQLEVVHEGHHSCSAQARSAGWG